MDDRIYAFQERYLLGFVEKRITPEKATALISDISRFYEVPKPQINFILNKEGETDGTKLTVAYYNYRNKRITFYANGLTHHTVLHEMAHYLEDYWGNKDRNKQHGKNFVGILIQLNHLYRGAPLKRIHKRLVKNRIPMVELPRRKGQINRKLKRKVLTVHSFDKIFYIVCVTAIIWAITNLFFDIFIFHLIKL